MNPSIKIAFRIVLMLLLVAPWQAYACTCAFTAKSFCHSARQISQRSNSIIFKGRVLPPGEAGLEVLVEDVIWGQPSSDTIAVMPDFCGSFPQVTTGESVILSLTKLDTSSFVWGNYGGQIRFQENFYLHGACSVNYLLLDGNKVEGAIDTEKSSMDFDDFKKMMREECLNPDFQLPILFTAIPNPAASGTTITLHGVGGNGPVEYVLTDLLGNHVDRGEMNSPYYSGNKISLLGIRSGMYILRIFTNGNSGMQRIVVAPEGS